MIVNCSRFAALKPFKSWTFSKVGTTFLVVLLGFMTTTLLASPLKTAKSSGLVGEQPDGYVGVIVDKPNVQLLVTEINRKRKVVYAGIAAKNDIQLQIVEKRSGARLIELTKPGNYVYINGDWQRK